MPNPSFRSLPGPVVDTLFPTVPYPNPAGISPGDVVFDNSRIALWYVLYNQGNQSTLVLVSFSALFSENQAITMGLQGVAGPMGLPGVEGQVGGQGVPGQTGSRGPRGSLWFEGNGDPNTPGVVNGDWRDED